MAFRGPTTYSKTSIPKSILSERGNHGPVERKQKYSSSSGYWKSVGLGSEGLLSGPGVPSRMKSKSVFKENMKEIPPRPALSDPSKRPREKHVTFQEPDYPERSRTKNKPLILDALLPHPSPTGRRQMSETKILIVRKGITTIASPLKTETADHSFAPMKEPYGKANASGDDDRVRFSVDMTGFEDDEIHLYTRGKKFVVEGFRSDCPPSIPSRRVKETVTLPNGVEPDNLRVSRDDRGVLHFEEAWIF